MCSVRYVSQPNKLNQTVSNLLKELFQFKKTLRLVWHAFQLLSSSSILVSY